MKIILIIGFFLSIGSLQTVHAQGQPLDSLLGRIGNELHNKTLADQLPALIPNYTSQRVWGFSTGDFSNDALPDLALSLYDVTGGKNQVHVYLFENVKNESLVKRFERTLPYLESPIEIGLSIEGSVVTITQKTGDQHWSQEGYSIESGDLTLVDRFETEKEDITSNEAKSKARTVGYDVYRNFENLSTREDYFTGASGDALLSTKYFTLPAYQRFRDIYPGYGHTFSDTSSQFIIDGLGLRKDAHDLSIRKAMAAYDDDYFYFSISVNDDEMVGGEAKDEANDRVSLWFDTKFTGDRANRDRHLLSKKGGFPTFRDALDSFVYNITFILPDHPGKISRISYSSVQPLSAQQQEALKNVRGQYISDTTNGVTTGYNFRVRIPFTFLGFESNPVSLYEKHVAMNTSDPTALEQNVEAPTDLAATLGFTALVYDVDDPNRPNETTVQATSNYKQGNPSTFGTLILEPSTVYYGEVIPTYTKELSSELKAAGY